MESGAAANAELEHSQGSRFELMAVIWGRTLGLALSCSSHPLGKSDDLQLRGGAELGGLLQILHRVFQ